MFELPVLLGLCVYFLLTTSFPLGDYPRDSNDSILASNLSNSRTVIVDRTANDYLTLLSAPFDVNDPNPVDRGYHYDVSNGEYRRRQVLLMNFEGGSSENLRDQITLSTALPGSTLADRDEHGNLTVFQESKRQYLSSILVSALTSIQMSSA